MGRRLRDAGLLAVAALAVVLAAVAFAAPGDSAPDGPIVALPHGAPDTTYAGPGGRVLLNGLWRFARDPRATGFQRGFEKGRFNGELVRVPYVPDAKKIAGRTGIKTFKGTVGWYRTNFEVTKAGRYAIGFQSVNHKAQVFLDGRRIATHVGEYLPFEARVDLEPGVRHKLVVRADWRSPTRMKRDGWHRLWFNFGGVNRNVTIRPVGNTDIIQPNLRTRLRNGAAVVNVTAALRNRTEPREIELKGSLTNGTRKIDLTFPKATVDADGAVPVEAEAVIPSPQLWSPATPNLWDLELEVPGEATYRAKVGLREVEADGRNLKINGREVYLRGASIHEDVYGRGDALTPADQDRVITGLKAINSNATRSQHPIDPGLLEKLDAAGIMVWQGVGPTDAPGAWTSRGERRVKVAKDRVRTTLFQAQLHPAIVTWNLANEVAGNGHPEGQIPYIDSMAAELKRRDPSRPIALDIWGAHPPRKTSRIYRNIDMIGWTNYIGWYESTFASPEEITLQIKRRLNQLRRVFPNKVIAVTEFGAEANGQNATNTPGGYEFQKNLLDLHLKTYASIPDIAGALIWNLRDFAVAPSFAGGSISRSVPNIKLVRGVNQKGLFSMSNKPKPSVREVATRFAAQAAAGK